MSHMRDYLYSLIDNINHNVVISKMDSKYYDKQFLTLIKLQAEMLVYISEFELKYGSVK